MIAICVIAVTSCSYNNGDKSSESHELYRIYVGDKYGFMNEKGEIVIEPQFDKAYYFFGDGVCYVENGEQNGLINEVGEFVAELDKNITWVYMFSHSLAICMIGNEKEGIINTKGEIIVPAIYKSIKQDGEKGFIVEDTNGNMGYINLNGDFVVPCKYDAVNGFNEGLMVVATSNKCGYVDSLGNWIIDTLYDDARGFGDGLARVEVDGKWMFIDHKGNAVSRLDYDEYLTGFANNRAFVKSEENIWLINKEGKKIKKIDADSVFGFSEGFATYVKDGKYGKIDTTGGKTILTRYEKFFAFNDGVATFVQNRKHGIIDTTGTVIIDAVHNMDARMINGLSLYYGEDTINGEVSMTYYDRRGNIIWKDMPSTKYVLPQKPTREDYKAYFDSRLSELDPIEGLYYVTFNHLAVDRDNDHQSSNGSKSKFYAIIRTPNTDEFIAYVADEDKPFYSWVKKFVQIGESNAYAIVNREDESKWSEDGKLILEDPYKFDVTLRTGGNNWYNWYVNCEFIKSYPSAEAFEQVQKAEWSGTGFAIADGYVVTNQHVVNGAKNITIRGVNGDNEKAYKGYVVASDREHDIAVIKIVDKKFKGFEDIPYCIGKVIPDMGDEVFVLGYPMTNTMGKDVKLTNGIISSTTGFKGDESMYQITAAVQPGNSGGPMFDNDGNVIGIVCAKHAEAENANYAIKVSYLYGLINSSGLGISLPNNNRVKAKSLSKKVKRVKPYVYLVECNSH